MTKAIFSAAALLGVAVVLAGCGGGGGGTVSTSGVAGASTAKASGSFHANVEGLQARLKSSVHAFENGNISGAIASGGSLLTSCTSTVDQKLAPNANTRAEKQSVRDLRTSCGYMKKAANAGKHGNMSAAKSWANKALQQANLAVKMLG